MRMHWYENTLIWECTEMGIRSNENILKWECTKMKMYQNENVLKWKCMEMTTNSSPSVVPKGGMDSNTRTREKLNKRAGTHLMLKAQSHQRLVANKIIFKLMWCWCTTRECCRLFIINDYPRRRHRLR